MHGYLLLAILVLFRLLVGCLSVDEWRTKEQVITKYFILSNKAINKSGSTKIAKGGMPIKNYNINFVLKYTLFCFVDLNLYPFNYF